MGDERILSSNEVTSASASTPGATIYCAAVMKTISSEECMELTRDPSHNHICIRHHKTCQSRFMICPICLKQAEHLNPKMKVMGPMFRVKNAKNPWCRWHNIYGDARRSDTDRREDIEHFEREEAKRLELLGPSQTPLKAAPEPEKLLAEYGQRKKQLVQGLDLGIEQGMLQLLQKDQGPLRSSLEKKT